MPQRPGVELEIAGQPAVSGASVAPTAESRLAGEPAFAPGGVIAERYRVVRFIARGGMGEVYEVEDAELRDRVALKTVRPELARDGVAVERFKREIQLARKVTHPNVCRIFDIAHHRGDGADPVIFLTMEMLSGETLAQRLRAGAQRGERRQDQPEDDHERDDDHDDPPGTGTRQHRRHR